MDTNIWTFKLFPQYLQVQFVYKQNFENICKYIKKNISKKIDYLLNISSHKNLSRRVQYSNCSFGNDFSNKTDTWLLISCQVFTHDFTTVLNRVLYMVCFFIIWNLIFLGTFWTLQYSLNIFIGWDIRETKLSFWS